MVWTKKRSPCLCQVSCVGCASAALFATCASQKRIVERDELHTREGATETKIGSVSLRVFDSSVASGHQLCTGTPRVGLFWLGTFTGRAARVHKCWRGSPCWTFCRLCARGPRAG